MKHKLEEICVSSETSLKTILKKLAENKSDKDFLPAGIILVIDIDYKLLGIATDGDIRRAIAGGAGLSTPVSKIMNTRPFLVEGSKSNTEILSLAVEKLRRENWHRDRLNKIIVVGKDKRLLDLVSFYDLWRRSDSRFKQIGVLGLGYVGLTLALTLADLGFKVRGFDINLAVRKSLAAGKPHFYEEGLSQILKDNSNKNFKIADNFNRDNNCDVYFIAVGTPLDKNKKPNLQYLKNAAEKVAKVLKTGDAVILRSTVPVGTTRSVVAPILEKYSGLKSGEGFFLAFAPERTVEGKALEELRTLPQVIGGINRVSGDFAANIFGHMTHSTVLVDSLEEAEVVKLINNTYRDVVFSFSNELSLICHRLGINTHRVIEAANRGYERSNVPLPSPGVGGACLEKDPFIFIESAKVGNYQPLLLQNARIVSNLMIDFLADEITGFLKNKKSEIKNPKILILGFAFKGRPVTSDVRGSTTLILVKKLQKQFKSIYGFDPAVRRLDITDHKVKYVADIKKGFENADAVVVMNNNLDFEELDIRALLKSANKPVLLFDTWGLYKKEEVEKVAGVEYRRL